MLATLGGIANQNYVDPIIYNAKESLYGIRFRNGGEIIDNISGYHNVIKLYSKNTWNVAFHSKKTILSNNYTSINFAYFTHPHFNNNVTFGLKKTYDNDNPVYNNYIKSKRVSRNTSRSVLSIDISEVNEPFYAYVRIYANDLDPNIDIVYVTDIWME